MSLLTQVGGVREAIRRPLSRATGPWGHYLLDRNVGNLSSWQLTELTDLSLELTDSLLQRGNDSIFLMELLTDDIVISHERFVGWSIAGRLVLALTCVLAIIADRH